jgi:2-keto-4-pentenoate hydratase/2-oxohepta-3-ene-1,7-dioic acid hydratase in catechol pathway
MKFASVRLNGTERPGVLAGQEIALFPAAVEDLVALISADPATQRELIRSALQSGPRIPLAGASLGAPIRRFRRDVLCTGWNYWDHFEEGFGKREGQDVERPKAPTFFTKSPEAVTGPNDPIAFDARISQKWDYEAELAAIIGRSGRSIPKSQAPIISLDIASPTMSRGAICNGVMAANG